MSLGWPLFGAALGALGLAPVILERQREPMNAEARKSATGEFVRLGRGLTHFQWHGPARGPVMVLVHGLTTPSFVWRGMLPHLVQMGYRVLSYDLFGRGYSDRPMGRQTAAFFTAQLSELLDDQGVGDDITLVGYSMGGAIATAFAADHPDRLRQLVLIAPVGMGLDLGRLPRFCAGVPVLGDWLFHMGYPHVLRAGARREAHLASSVENMTNLQLGELEDRGFLRSVLSSIRGAIAEDLEPAHRRIAATDLPVAAIWGGADTVIPIAGLGTLAQWNRAARQEVIDGAAHGLVFHDTDALVSVLRQLLSEPRV